MALAIRWRRRLLAFLQDGGPRALVLDNAETPLGADPHAEELLQHLAGLPGVAVAATVRPNAPLGAGWRRPVEVPPVAPVYARQIFLGVTSNQHADDPALDGLLARLDGWPLALTLAGVPGPLRGERRRTADPLAAAAHAVDEPGRAERAADLAPASSCRCTTR